MANGQPNCCASDVIRQTAGLRSTSTIAVSPSPIKQRWSDPIKGDFLLGNSKPSRFEADGEGPQRQVTLSPFQISCYAVTNAQFGDYVRDTGYITDAERYGWSFVFAGLLTNVEQHDLMRAAQTPWWVKVPHAYWAQPEGPHSDILARLRHPVVHVSWNDVAAYCAWSDAELPTEAQWEAAARGGLTGAVYPWGDELMPGGRHRCNIWQGRFPDINTAEDGFAGTAPVDAFDANALGLYNTVGNVWEWCRDYFSNTYHRDTRDDDPLALTPSAQRSMRGGSFLCHESYCDRYRVTARSANTPDSSASNIGFRVARPA